MVYVIIINWEDRNNSNGKSIMVRPGSNESNVSFEEGELCYVSVMFSDWLTDWLIDWLIEGLIGFP